MTDPEGKGPRQALEATYAYADRWLRLRKTVVPASEAQARSPRHVLEYPDWVDVIALTADRNIVLVDQYRHAVGQARTEFPAGAVEDAEEPLAAMKRELLEETGYVSDEWHLLGIAAVYPALQTNRIHSFLALNARRVAAQTLDEGEFIQTHELPFSEFIERVQSGSLELPALQLAGLWWLRTRLSRPPLSELGGLLRC